MSVEDIKFLATSLNDKRNDKTSFFKADIKRSELDEKHMKIKEAFIEKNHKTNAD